MEEEYEELRDLYFSIALSLVIILLFLILKSEMLFTPSFDFELECFSKLQLSSQSEHSSSLESLVSELKLILNDLSSSSG